MKITEMDIKDLKPYTKNNKLHPPEQIEKIANSIKEFGFNVPILVDKDYNIIAGHGRLEALKKLGIDKVPTLCLDNLDKDQIKAYRIMDNKSAESDWNMDFLKDELKELQMSDYDMDLTGFDQTELNDIFGNDTDNDVELKDVEPEDAAKVETTIKKGNIILLGNHRLMCGDSTSSEDVGILMQDEKADMCFTDPPYLMNFTGNVHADGSKSFNAKYDNIKNDNMSREEGDKFIFEFIKQMELNVKGSYYITFYRLGIDYIFRALDKLNNKYKSLIIWDKGNHTLSNSDYMSKYEPVIYGWFGEHNFYGPKAEFDIWNIPRTQKNDLHPTMKPIELCSRAIKNSSKQGDIVLDLFGGSGSTLIAAENLNRKCLMMELDTQYCEVICQRWEKLTGKTRQVI